MKHTNKEITTKTFKKNSLYLSTLNKRAYALQTIRYLLFFIFKFDRHYIRPGQTLPICWSKIILFVNVVRNMLVSFKYDIGSRSLIKFFIHNRPTMLNDIFEQALLHAHISSNFQYNSELSRCYFRCRGGNVKSVRIVTNLCDDIYWRMLHT